MPGVFVYANHHDKMRRAKFAADQAHHATGVHAEQAQQYPAIKGENGYEETTQIEAQSELTDNQADRPESALPKCLAKNDARMGGIEALIKVEPISQRYPHHQ